MSDELNKDLIDFKLESIEKKVIKIFDLLDGEKGIVAQTAVHGSAIKRIWWLLGGCVMGILGIAFFVIRTGVT